MIAGSAGIGFETARRARAEGAKVILTARNPERLKHAATAIDASSTAAFDATDFKLLQRFFDGLPAPVDHILVTGPGPYYAPLADFDFERARRDIEAHWLLPLQIARNARNKVRPGVSGSERGARMSSIHMHQTTTSTPEQYTAGLTDFGPGRSKLFGNSANENLKVHNRGPSQADVTEGSGGIWERLHYDWSDPNHVVLTTTDSNTCGGASGHTYTFTRRPDGSTDIDRKCEIGARSQSWRQLD